MRDIVGTVGTATATFTVDVVAATIHKDGMPIALGVRERPVVMALALHGPLSRQRLCDLIHADTEDGGSPESVKVYVHRVRRRTAPCFIVSRDGAYELGKSVHVSRATFREGARAEDLSPLTAANVEALRLRARKLRAPIPTPMVEYDWFASVALAQQRSGRQLALNLARECMNRRSYFDAIQIATELTFEDPCDEDAWEAVIRCQVLLGQRSAAAHSYRFLTASLQKDLGVRPSFDGFQLISAR
jgi:DNA-binding SARP family transcriptional activator